MRVFHIQASYPQCSLASYTKVMKKKEERVLVRVCEVERGTFTPLVMFTTGSMAGECTTFFRYLVSLVSHKHQQ